MADQTLSQSFSSSGGETLEALKERQKSIKVEILTDINSVQESILNLTTEMANEVKEYTTDMIHSSENVFQDVESLRSVITELGASQISMQKLFASFSGNLSSILLGEQTTADNSSDSAPESSTPTNLSRSFSTPLAFSMAQDFNREGILCLYLNDDRTTLPCPTNHSSYCRTS